MTPSKRKGNTAQERWTHTAEQMRTLFPHLMAFCADTESFLGLHLKVKDDGVVLSVAKGFSPDGSPVVSFGVGYDIFLSLMALDGSIQGGNWKEDKPWRPK